MKTKKCLMLLMLLVLFSCSNDNLLESDFIESKPVKIVSIASAEDLNALFNEAVFLYKESGMPESIEAKASASQLITKVGYSNIYVSDVIYQVYFTTQTAADLVGLSMDVMYVADLLQVRLNVDPIGSSISAYNSPLCGMKPFNNPDNAIFGYDVKLKLNVGVDFLFTNVFHIKADGFGNTYDKHYPRTPSTLVWKYLLN